MQVTIEKVGNGYVVVVTGTTSGPSTTVYTTLAAAIAYAQSTLS